MKYTNPPIVEVICELHFDLKEPLPNEKIAALRAVWKDAYPKQSDVENKEFQLQVGPEGITSNQKSLGKKLFCKSADATRIAQLSGTFLAVNQLKPYAGWEESFRDTVVARAQEVEKTIGPMTYKRVGLRYINRLDIPQFPLVWDDWFELRIPTPPLANSQVSKLQMKFELILPDDCRLMATIISLPPVDGKLSPVILDLDVMWRGSSIEFSKIPDYLDRVHKPHRLAFEGYVKDKTRQLFA